MKKISALILALALTLSLFAGCSDKDDAKTESFDYLEADLSQYVVLGQYKGLEIDMTPEASEDDIDDAITDLIISNATINEITDRAAENGDTVNIDFAGFREGVQFEGGTAEDFPLELGSGSFIDGFEEGLVGVMPGQTVSLDLSFPDPYPNNPDLAGKPVVFEVTINYIEETVYPEYNDEFVTLISEGEYTNTADYYHYIKATLEADLAEERAASKQSILLTQVLENTEVKGYPEEEYKTYYDEFISYYAEYASYYGMTLADFMLAAYETTEAEFYAVAEEYAYETVASNLIIAAVARAEGLSLSDEEYDAGIEGVLASNSGFASKEELIEYYGEDYLRWYFLQEEVLQFIDDNSVTLED